MDLQKRSESLVNAKKSLVDKTAADKLHKAGKFTAYDLVAQLFDDGTFVETNAYVKAYANEISTADTAEYEGVVCGYGAVDGRLTFVYAQNAARLNGAFSKAAAEKIAALYDMAKKNGAPVVSVFDSNGAKLEEGIDVLSGYGKVMKKACALKGKVPQLAVVVGNCAGAAATIASMADVTVMAEGASYSMTPASVLSANGAEKNVASAEYASSKGVVDVVCATVPEAFAAVKDVLSFLPSNKLDTNVYTGIEDDPNRATSEVSSIVASASYDVHSVIAALADGGKFLELGAGKSKSIVTGFATVNGIVVGVVANNPAQREGKLCKGCMNKAADFISLCNTFGISVLTLVDTNGFCVECEAKGKDFVSASARLAVSYCKADVPMVTVNVGSAYGTAFTIMGSKELGADMVIALDSAKIGVLKPGAGVAMMWSEKMAGAKAPIEKRKALEEEWELLMSTPVLAAQAGQVDDIIPASELRVKVASAVEMLSMKREFASL